MTIVGTITVTTQNVTSPITVALKGANANKFKVSAETLPAEGGALAVGFEGTQAGVHEAYIELSSPEAASVFIPMSVLCKDASTDLESAQNSAVRTQKIIRNGQLLILRDGKVFTILGNEIK